jgi:hypothetical protein
MHQRHLLSPGHRRDVGTLRQRPRLLTGFIAVGQWAVSSRREFFHARRTFEMSAATGEIEMVASMQKKAA